MFDVSLFSRGASPPLAYKTSISEYGDRRVRMKAKASEILKTRNARREKDSRVQEPWGLLKWSHRHRFLSGGNFEKVIEMLQNEKS